MTVEIKHSWLTANEAKPLKMRRVAKYYRKRLNQLFTSLQNLKKFGLKAPKEFITEIYSKIVFYQNQEEKLLSYAKYLETRKENEHWKDFEKLFLNGKVNFQKTLDSRVDYYLKYYWVF